MIFLRSLVFNLVWYVNIIVQMVGQCWFYFFLSHEKALDVPRRWAFSSNWLHTLIVGTKIDVSGLENVPQQGCIIASKHQSVWEFYGLWALLKNPSFILKAELMKIPFFGWYVAKVDQIPIRRGDKSKALRRMLADARIAIENNRQVLIFPEGTRKAPGAETDYRYGVTRMYLELDCPVVPVALTSGLFWPRRKFVRYPGTLRARFLEPIMPGLSGPEFSAELERRIEEACDDLYLQTSQDANHPPLDEAVRARITAAKARVVDKATK